MSNTTTTSTAIIVHPAYVPCNGIPAGLDLLLAFDVLDHAQHLDQNQSAEIEDLNWLLGEDEDPWAEQAREWNEQLECNRRDRAMGGMARTYDRSGWLHRLW